jgi:hypothetical protein
MEWIGRQIVGAWRLFTWDKDGLDYLDKSPQAAWVSCFLPLVVAPLLVTLLAHLRGDSVIPTIVYITGYSLALLIAHFGYLLAMKYVTEWMDRPVDQWVGYMAAYNWATVIQFFILLIPIFLILGQIGGEQTGQSALLAGQLIIYPYLWFMVKVGLKLSWWAAILAVIADMLISDLIGGLTIQLLITGGS